MNLIERCDICSRVVPATEYVRGEDVLCRYCTADRNKAINEGRSTRVRTSGPNNSTPFTVCCGTAALTERKCPSCGNWILASTDAMIRQRQASKL